MATKGTKRTIYRSSVTGRLVKRSYAKSHPKTTETERVRVSSRRVLGRVTSKNGPGRFAAGITCARECRAARWQ